MLENVIFPFNDTPALQVQCPEKCRSIYVDFWHKLVDSEWANLAFPDQVDWKRAPDRVLCHEIEWFPRYASAVLFRKLDSLQARVTVVGLDGWKRGVHAWEQERQCIATPDIFRPVLFEQGTFPLDHIEDLVVALDEKLRKSEADFRGDRRGHRDGNEGNQKTPSFLNEKLRQAINVVAETEEEMTEESGFGCSIQGGTTDVGKHTGCLVRNTSSPLVFSAIREILRISGEPDDDCFRTLLAIYFVRFLDNLPKPTVYDARKFDRFMIVIREAEPHVLAMKHGELRKKILEFMKGYRDDLDRVPYYSTPPPTLEHGFGPQ